MERRSKDKVENKDGKRSCSLIGGGGWGILNGRVKRDEEGNWTFTGERGCSVIDYIVVSEVVKKRADRMEVQEKVDLDHLPVVVWIKGGGREIARGSGGRGDRVSRDVWTKSWIELFRRKFGG